MLAEGRLRPQRRQTGWWIPSGRVFYSPDPADRRPQELAIARQHFFLPRRYRDPFHTTRSSTESVVDLRRATTCWSQETRDALGNRVTAGERDVDPTRPLVAAATTTACCSPALVMDPNRNRSAVAFDALGMVAGTAVMGKPEDVPVPGDRLAGLPADLTQAQTSRVLADPNGPPAAALLDDATTRIVYDLDAYWRAGAGAGPAVPATASLARETHASDPVPAGGLRDPGALSYSDGFGREIQRRCRPSPDPFPCATPPGRIVVDADGQPRCRPAPTTRAGWAAGGPCPRRQSRRAPRRSRRARARLADRGSAAPRRAGSW